MSLFNLPRALAFDADGRVVSGAKLAFYSAGTSTPKDTYSDNILTIPNTNPVIANSSGLFGPIYLGTGSYKVTLSDSDDVELWSQDSVVSLDADGIGAVPDTAAITAGDGIAITESGVVADNPVVSVDISALDPITVAQVAATDGILVDDAGVAKRMSFEQMGIRVQAAATATLAVADNNTIYHNSGADNYTITLPSNATAAIPIGGQVGLICSSTGTITLEAGSGATVTSLDSFLAVRASGGMAVAVKVATDAWVLGGDLA
jgi:hypothetical protein